MNDENKQPESEVPETEVLPSFPKQVWDKLSRVDVSDHIETAEIKKDGRVVYTYQYLGWSWAWAQLMSFYPESVLRILPEDVLENGTVMVNIEIEIRQGTDLIKRQMWLPVMNQKNDSIQNPTTRQLSDSRMRALVKCLAMGYGLGLDLWAGGDMPVGMIDDLISPEKLELLAGLYARLTDDGKKGFLAWLDVEKLADIPEGRYQSARTQLERKISLLPK